MTDMHPTHLFNMYLYPVWRGICNMLVSNEARPLAGLRINFSGIRKSIVAGEHAW